MDLVDRLAATVLGLTGTRDRVLVGIDGPDTAGKSTLAYHLAERLSAGDGGGSDGEGRGDRDGIGRAGADRCPVTVVRASIDGFHAARATRYRRGGLSGEGYYRDSFDYPALIDGCLAPFRDGAASVVTASFEFRADTGRTERVEVPARAVLVFDGVFLLRPGLREFWTLPVYLRVTPGEALRRARARDVALFGSEAEVERRYLERYLPGQALYRAEADPERAALIVVDNERPETPVVVRWSR